MDIVLMIILLFALLAIRTPVAISLICVGIFGMAMVGRPDGAMGLLATTPFRTASNYAFTVIPMFLLMAALGNRSGIVSELFTFGKRWFGHLPGGLAIATTISSGLIGAMSGSSVGAAGMLGATAVPEMEKMGYSSRLSLGVVACAGTFAIMIPPSIALVIYAIIAEQSIGKLLIAGIIPGLLTILVYCGIIIVWAKLRPDEAPVVDVKYSWGEKFETFFKIWPALLLIFVILGAIFAGVATPSEAGAIGAFAMMILVALDMRNLREFGSTLKESLMDSLKPTAMIIFIIVGALILGYAFVSTGITKAFTLFVVSLNVPPVIVLIIFMLLLTILGMVMSQIAVLFITMPLLIPAIVSLGYDPIWFGIIAVKTAEIGLVTPPVGTNVFVVAAASGHKAETVFAGIWPFIVADVIVIALLVIFPQLPLLLLRAM